MHVSHVKLFDLALFISCCHFLFLLSKFCLPFLYFSMCTFRPDLLLRICASYNALSMFTCHWFHIHSVYLHCQELGQHDNVITQFTCNMEILLYLHPKYTAVIYLHFMPLVYSYFHHIFVKSCYSMESFSQTLSVVQLT